MGPKYDTHVIPPSCGGFSCGHDKQADAALDMLFYGPIYTNAPEPQGCDTLHSNNIQPHIKTLLLGLEEPHHCLSEPLGVFRDDPVPCLDIDVLKTREEAADER